MDRIIAWICSATWALSSALASYPDGNVWWLSVLGVVASLLAAGIAIYEAGKARHD